jgi:predicted unusual protein kinase regulating ubiquinone biosynthesis (AarF/ABC1/UbiB family)
MADRETKGMAVPRRRLGRLARVGGLGTSIAGNMLSEGARTLARGERVSFDRLLLTPGNAQKVAEQLAQLRGAAMKVGQLMSMGGDDMLPPEIAEVFARLREQAHHMPPQQLRRVLDDAWGKGWMTRLKRFDPKPIAAASIGQVHRAISRDGRDLAVKVQYPGVRESIDSDVDNVVTLLRLSQQAPKGMNLGPLFEEGKKQLHEEADYLREGAYMERFAALLGDDLRFVVPRLEEDLTTPDVLTMSFERGEPIETLAAQSQDMRDEVVRRLFDLVIQELFVFRLIQTDPNFANYRFRPEDGQVVLLDFGATREVPEKFSDGYKALIEAGLRNDWEAIRERALALGLFGGELKPVHEEALRDMFLAGLEPLRTDEPFDFAASDVTLRIRDAGESLRRNEFVHTPNPVLLFLHRKIGGMYLLAARVGARVNVRALLREHGFD